MVADHLRATTFLIGDGVMPGNEGRGYVLRKIMRRALRHGRKLGLEGAFLNELTAAVVERMAGAYPELRSQAPSIARVVRAEEERFGSTLKQAMAEFEKVGREAGGSGGAKTIPGADAFRLYDTYGLPLDFLEELAQDASLKVDRDGFERELEGQRERARRPARWARSPATRCTWGCWRRARREFARLRGPRPRGGDGPGRAPRGPARHPPRRGPGGRIVLDRTPFYGASGGQVGDHGVIAAEGSAAEVVDCDLPVPGLYVHHVKVITGGFEAGMKVRVQVDQNLPRGRHAQPHRHPPAPRGAARDARHPREAGGQPGGAGPAALRLQPLRGPAARASSATSRTA